MIPPPNNTSSIKNDGASYGELKSTVIWLYEISNEREKIIDSKYKNGMPEEWNYETDDVFARLSICNIDWDPI